MKSSWPSSKPRRKRFGTMPLVATVTALLGLGSVATWFLRDGRAVVADKGTVEGSLRLNINTATLTELESIPGIGESLAKLIVARRPYQSLDELLEIHGIGANSLEKLRPFVKVDGETEKLR